MKSRQQVLEDLVQRYSEELSQAWASNMSPHRVQALAASLKSARAELRELLRKASDERDV
jgi:type VI protein secretion system component VasK